MLLQSYKFNKGSIFCVSPKDFSLSKHGTIAVLSWATSLHVRWSSWYASALWARVGSGYTVKLRRAATLGIQFLSLIRRQSEGFGTDRAVLAASDMPRPGESRDSQHLRQQTLSPPPHKKKIRKPRESFKTLKPPSILHHSTLLWCLKIIPPPGSNFL